MKVNIIASIEDYLQKIKECVHEDVYYHGTSLENASKILTIDKFICHDYGFTKGFWLTNSFEHACMFGEVILILKNIDKSKIDTSDSNNESYGFYEGSCSIEKIDKFILTCTEYSMRKLLQYT